MSYPLSLCSSVPRASWAPCGASTSKDAGIPKHSLLASPSTAWAVTAELNEGVKCHLFITTANNFAIVLAQFIASVHASIALQSSVGKIGRGRKQKRIPSIQ
jgi:hypothetical protein